MYYVILYNVSIEQLFPLAMNSAHVFALKFRYSQEILESTFSKMFRTSLREIGQWNSIFESVTPVLTYITITLFNILTSKIIKVIFIIFLICSNQYPNSKEQTLKTDKLRKSQDFTMEVKPDDSNG